jgi:serine/threonine protein kinase/WD40 repeat protein
MDDSSPKRIPVEQVAESFLQRFRRGERPSLTEYCERHPELAQEIRDLFPALVVMERLAPDPRGDGAHDASASGRMPDRLGEYRILREIGRGGMGVVYEAEQESLGRHVALKVLARHALMDAKHLERFQREARAAARLHHTNIVPIFGVGEHAGVHYYAMQFIQGQGLDEVLGELCRLRRQARHEPAGGESQLNMAGHAARSMAAGLEHVESRQAIGLEPSGNATESNASPQFSVPPSRVDGPASTIIARRSDSTHRTATDTEYFRSVARLGAQVAEALSYAHGQGVLHRDIKPANLLLDAQGTVWVTDFGLAKIEGMEDLTHAGDIVGTLRYMAPERLDGRVDGRSDVYSLGLTLYELLAMRPAFESSDRRQLIKQIAQEEPPRPRRIDSAVPADLETIVLKATAKEPRDRYQSAAEVAGDLQLFLADRPIQARRTSPIERLTRWCRRNPGMAAATGAAAILLVAVAVISSVAAFRLHEERNATRNQLGLTERAERQSEYRLYETRLALARASRLSGRMGQRFDSLNAIADAARLIPRLGLGAASVTELRDEAVAAMSLMDLQVKQPGSAAPGSIALAIDTAHERYLCMDSSGVFGIRELKDHGEALRLPDLEVSNEKLVARFSRDGRYVAIGHGPRSPAVVEVWDLESESSASGDNLRASPPLNGPVARRLIEAPGAGVDFSMDGLGAAIAAPDGTATVYRLPSGKVSKQFAVGPDAAQVQFSPDATLLAVSRGNRPEVEVYDVQNGESRCRLQHTQQTADLVRSVAWHPSGKVLVVAAGRLITFWNIGTGEQSKVLEGHDGRVFDLSFNRTGTVLASTAADGVVRLWDFFTYKSLVGTLDGSQDLAASGSLQFDPDDRGVSLISANGRPISYRLVTGPVRCTMDGHQGMGPLSLDFSRSGSVLATTGRKDPVRLWDVRSGHQIGAIESRGNYSVFFERSGTSLLTCGGPDHEPVQRWPFAVSETATESPYDRGPENRHGLSVQVGKPQRLFPEPKVGSECMLAFASLSDDGKTLALIDDVESRVVVLNVDAQGASVRWSIPQPKPRHLALSPDGRWLGVSQEPDFDVGIWDAQTGELACQIPGEPGQSRARLAFSPDSQWLVTALVDEYRLWRVGAWEPGLRLSRNNPGGTLPGFMAFRRDGRLMALAHSQKLVILVNPASGEQVVRLHAPDLEPVTHLDFSDDGNSLAVGNFKNQIYVWDLRQLRRELAALQLDWVD